MRNNQITRVLVLARLLEEHAYGLSLTDLCDRLKQACHLDELSERTVRRDLEALSRAGFHVAPEEHDGKTLWLMDLSKAKALVTQLSACELLALNVGRDLLAPLAGTDYWEGITTLWDKLAKMAAPGLRKLLDDDRKALMVRAPQFQGYAAKRGIISTLHRAIHQHQVVRILYRSAAQKSATAREVCPYAIVLSDSKLYLVADAPDGGPAARFRVFKLDRLSKAEALDRRFKRDPGFDLQAHFEAAIGVFHRGHAQRFELWFSPKVAAWVVEAPFHPQQQVREQSDGSLVVTIAKGYEDEIVSRVLSLGADARVLGPATTRQRMVEAARAIAEAHGRALSAGPASPARPAR